MPDDLEDLVMDVSNKPFLYTRACAHAFIHSTPRSWHQQRLSFFPRRHFHFPTWALDGGFHGMPGTITHDAARTGTPMSNGPGLNLTNKVGVPQYLYDVREGPYDHGAHHFTNGRLPPYKPGFQASRSPPLHRIKTPSGTPKRQRHCTPFHFQHIMAPAGAAFASLSCLESHFDALRCEPNVTVHPCAE
ncbi:hypothetical protein BD309DRAFT_968595 [Dichomitus squalens]|nr:hypothetical protein BD309DRAFT_968595 [Dichomitus squalens]